MSVHHMRPLMLVAQPTLHARSFNFSLGPTMVRRAERKQVCKIRPHIVQHLVTGTSIQSLRGGPMLNFVGCVDRFGPKGFRPADLVEIGAAGLGGYPNCSFASPINRRVGRDWGCSLIHLARRCRASCPSIIRVHCPSCKITIYGICILLITILI